MGTILRVNLGTGKIVKEPLSEYLMQNYIGGRGINVRILYDEVSPGTEPLSPHNVLIFGTGTLTGTPLASGRLNITAMSPQTGILGDSNAGSHFAPEMKYAGYDHIVFSGKAKKPVYLWIDDDRVELRDAQHLWGKMTDETQAMIMEELGDKRIQISCIGPAGENLVRLASVMVGGDGCCGRCGLGAVMGSKNLKAVAVRGTKGVKVHDPEALRKYVLELRERAKRNQNYKLLSTYGTPWVCDRRNERGLLTLRNGQETGSFWGFDEIKAETLRKKYIVKEKACFGCINHCRKWFEIKDGPYAGLKGVGIEVSVLQAWGSLHENAYAPSLYKAFHLCNQYGMDEIECGQLIAAATEWYEKGIISKKDMQGVELNWQNHTAMIEMIHKIARREGIGDLLAEDAVIAAKTLGHGAEKCISHSKGMLKTNNDIRAAPIYAFGHAIATRGADHLRGAMPSYIPPGQYEGVAKAVFENNYVCTMADTLEICKFSTTYIGLDITFEDTVKLFGIVTGLKLREREIRRMADRIWTLERAFIAREGVTRKDDRFIGRVMDGPVHGGPLDGFSFDPKKWDEMLDEYYDLVGWDRETGIPTRKKLEELGLKEVADELESMGKFQKVVK
ncbi:aldehyde ferredoxin oxidoreductase family protein [Chloroflexota bacterium]